MQEIKIPISAQAAMLTEEQRQNVEKSYKVCTIMNVIAILVIVVMFAVVYFSVKGIDAQIADNDAQIEVLNIEEELHEAAGGGYDSSYYNRRSALYDRNYKLFDAREMVLYSFLIVFGIAFVIYMAVFFCIWFSYKKKYPYFGERMFWAVRKLRKQEKKNLQQY